jgi:hypothetical protein
VADKVIYYAIIDEASSLSRPAGVLRRTEKGGGKIDEVFSGALSWVPSPLLRSAEHGDITDDFTEISAGEAEQIVARIRDGAADSGVGS